MKQSWVEKKLGEVLLLEYGKPLPKEDRNPDGLYPAYGANGIKARTDKFLVSGKSIIVGRKGSAGEINYTEDKFWALDVTYYTKFDSNILDLDFLYYLLSLLKLPKLAKGVKPGINRNDVYAITIQLPPLEEQKQIVAKLDQCFEAIDKAKANAAKNLENAKELFQSKLNDIFSQKGEGWVEKRLGDVCKYDKNKNQSNNLPYIGLEHIESNSGRFIGSIKSHQVKSSTFHFDSRHVLYGRLRPYLNKVLIPNFEGHCSTEIFPILVGNEIMREYLFYWLISDQTVKKIDATCTGARMPRANMNEVINFILPIPQVEEQKQIVKLLGNLKEQTQSLESKYQQELNSLEGLKKSILQKAFEGEL